MSPARSPPSTKHGRRCRAAGSQTAPTPLQSWTDQPAADQADPGTEHRQGQTGHRTMRTRGSVPQEHSSPRRERANTTASAHTRQNGRNSKEKQTSAPWQRRTWTARRRTRQQDPPLPTAAGTLPTRDDIPHHTRHLNHTKEQESGKACSQVTVELNRREFYSAGCTA